jgi:hypothetical protein
MNANIHDRSDGMVGQRSPYTVTFVYLLLRTWTRRGGMPDFVKLYSPLLSLLVQECEYTRQFKQNGGAAPTKYGNLCTITATYLDNVMGHVCVSYTVFPFTVATISIFLLCVGQLVVNAVYSSSIVHCDQVQDKYHAKQHQHAWGWPTQDIHLRTSGAVRCKYFSLILR